MLFTVFATDTSTNEYVSHGFVVEADSPEEAIILSLRGYAKETKEFDLKDVKDEEVEETMRSSYGFQVNLVVHGHRSPAYVLGQRYISVRIMPPRGR